MLRWLINSSQFSLKLYELDNDPKRKEFLDDLFAYMQKRGRTGSINPVKHTFPPKGTYIIRQVSVGIILSTLALLFGNDRFLIGHLHLAWRRPPELSGIICPWSQISILWQKDGPDGVIRLRLSSQRHSLNRLLTPYHGFKLNQMESCLCWSTIKPPVPPTSVRK